MKIDKPQLWHHATASALFLLSAILYLATMAPTVSLWDCGEFISCAARLEVGHPPGAPFFLLLGRFFTLFAADASQIAWWSNLLSVLASAATIALLYYIIAHIIRFSWPTPTNNFFRTSVPAAIGALLFAVTDTFWFSAVESEVYALSMFFTAITFWAILKWEEERQNNQSGLRWIVLISYLTGLSIGVHLLNLLAIPVLVMIVWFRMQHFGWKEMGKALLVGFLILGVILFLFVQNGLWLAAKMELFMVNQMGLPLQSGLITFVLLLFAILFYAVFKTRAKNNLLHFISINLLVFFIGYGSYALIIIRANAQTPINLNDPSHVFAFDSFMNREQYGDRPLLYGPYYNAKPEELNSKEAYRPANGKYEAYKKMQSYTYNDANCGFLPRMHSQQQHHIYGYSYWAGVDPQSEEKPSFAENLKFLFRYQIDFMYLRYFMWNFAGRQNDNQGQGDLMDGNWISGITPLDGLRLGERSELHPGESHNKAHNRYYLLPLIFGVAGMVFMGRNNREAKQYFREVLLLLIMTGPAIVLYLNQTPYEPRERDYAFVGSFFAFSIFIGLGVYALMHWVTEKQKIKWGHLLSGTIAFLALPALVLSENYDDHDRSNRYFDLNIARSYLESCEPNAILFTYGDNDTYPLWYAQEVEGIRTDVRVINYGLMGADWCIHQLARKSHQSEAMPFSIPLERYRESDLDNALMLDQSKDYADLKSVVRFIGSNDKASKLPVRTGDMLDFSPTRNLYATTPAGDTIRWEIKKEVLYKNDIALLDILASNNWERPVYFTTGGDTEIFLGLDNYLRNDGLVLKVDPTLYQHDERQRAELRYKIFMEKIVLGQAEGCYYDHFVRRTFDVVRYRNHANSLAKALIKLDEKEKARQVLEKSLSELPIAYYPESQGNIEMISLLNEAGANQLAQQTASTLLEHHVLCLRHFIANINNNAQAYNYALQEEAEKGQQLRKQLITLNDTTLLNEMTSHYELLGLK